MRAKNGQMRNSTPTMVINQFMQDHKLTPRHARHACTHEDSAQEISQILYRCVELNLSRELLFQDYIKGHKGLVYSK